MGLCSAAPETQIVPLGVPRPPLPSPQLKAQTLTGLVSVPISLRPPLSGSLHPLPDSWFQAFCTLKWFILCHVNILVCFTPRPVGPAYDLPRGLQGT